MQCFFFFSQFFNWKKGISYCFPTSDESWVRGRQEEVLREGPQAWSRQPSWLSRISRALPLLSFSSAKQPPLPCLLAPTFPLEKLHFNNHCFYQGCGLPPHQDHQDPTRASPSLILIQRATPRTHLLACLSALCKLFRGGAARCPPNCKYKIILSPLQELFLTFPSLLKTSITIYFPVSHSKYGLLKIFLTQVISISFTHWALSTCQIVNSAQNHPHSI